MNYIFLFIVFFFLPSQKNVQKSAKPRKSHGKVFQTTPSQFSNVKILSVELDLWDSETPSPSLSPSPSTSCRSRWSVRRRLRKRQMVLAVIMFGWRDSVQHRRSWEETSTAFFFSFFADDAQTYSEAETVNYYFSHCCTVMSRRSRIGIE